MKIEKSTIRSVIVVFLAYGGFLAAQGLAEFAYTALLPSSVFWARIAQVVLSMGLLTLVIGLVGLVEKRTLCDYGLYTTKRSIFLFLLGLTLGAAAFLLVVLPLYLTGQYTLTWGEGGWEDVGLGLLQFTGVGYVEELLFRGFIQHHMRGIGKMPALVFSSLLFAAIHLSNPNFYWLAFLNIFLAGMFIGAVMYATGSLWAAIGVHITWNWIQGSVLGIPVSGLSSLGWFSTEIIGKKEILTGGKFGAEASIVCSIVLALLTLSALWIARRTGNDQIFGMNEIRKKE